MRDLKAFFDLRKAQFDTLYSVLDEAKFAWTLPTSIFIDIDHLIKSMYKEDTVKIQEFAFSSAMLNFAGYFRYFFWKQHVRTNIYFYGSKDLGSIVPNHKDYIETELKYLGMIVKNIPGIYLIQSEMPSRLIPFALYSKSTMENTIVMSYEKFAELYPYFMSFTPSYTLHLAGKHSSVINRFTKKWSVNPIDVLAINGDSMADIPAIKRLGEHRATLLIDKHKNMEEYFKGEELNRFLKNKEYYDVKALIEKYKNEFFTIESDPALVDYHNTDQVKAIRREYYSVQTFSIQQLYLGEE